MALLLHVLSSVMHRCAHCHPGQRPSPPGVSGGWSPGCARGAGPGGPPAGLSAPMVCLTMREER